MLAHDSFDPLAADGLALGAQFSVGARRSVLFPVPRMDPPDVVWESGRFTDWLRRST
jgi:hypothetical protein